VSIVAGADACRGGWLAIVLDDGRVADSLVAQAAADDVLDAAIAAWSAARKARGEAVPLPPDLPVQDGRPVAIWY
jgi:predicted RNase H-like nuclease